MEGGRLIYTRNDFLSEDCADVVGCVGFVVFFVDLFRYVLVFDFVYFQVEDFALGFS